MKVHDIALVLAGLLAAAGTAHAQTPAPAQPQAAPAAQAQAPTSLSIYFALGGYAISKKSEATLDEASRIFNDGKPIVMIITGTADATGAPGPNLLLSQRRADAVFAGLVTRGLPPGRFQILAKGATEMPTGHDASGPDQALRKVEITWR